MDAHCPQVRMLVEAPEGVVQASRNNLRHAFRAACLLLPHTFGERELYMVSGGEQEQLYGMVVEWWWNDGGMMV